MKDKSEKTARGRKPKQQARYPAVEMAAAALGIHYWAIGLADPQYQIKPTDRKTRLGKLALVKQAMAEGVTTGKDNDIPNEIIRDEFNLLYPAASALHARIAQIGEIEKKVALVQKARVGVLAQSVEISRPIFVGCDPDRLWNIVANIRSPNLGRARFSRYLVGETYGFAERTIDDKIKKANDEDRDRTKVSPSQQLVLTLMLIGGSLSMKKQKRASSLELIEAAEILKQSGIHPMKLYHLCRFISEKAPTLDVEYNHETFAKACGQLRIGMHEDGPYTLFMD